MRLGDLGGGRSGEGGREENWGREVEVLVVRRNRLRKNRNILVAERREDLSEKKALLKEVSNREQKCAKLESDMAKLGEELEMTRTISRAAEVQANRDLILREGAEETRRLQVDGRIGI